VVESEWLKGHTYLKHLGIYAFRPEVLRAITALDTTPLERTEKLEQLRWLEHGYHISVAETPFATIGIDTPEDLARAERLLEML
jgi:3-deoxy-manno-octulosonate cytidylyltransferase (CMP-KDO synthetase)